MSPGPPGGQVRSVAASRSTREPGDCCCRASHGGVGGAERRTWTGGFVVPNGGVADEVGSGRFDDSPDGVVIVTAALDALVV